ncbi:hypothetical protein IHC88_04215 [Photobacterium damselae subsp. damselae]|uniref:lipopolysaccharide biosynthesis protein n=1 Tax=Photobacterium damselae TaxID=38293 RepID=UPI001F213F1E|nr:hypothetical protein [Photobacterium damselae]UJZ98560.1 hypothetical protein IHC88_04215 [Photobacterium damselae subsp. damselae]
MIKFIIYGLSVGINRGLFFILMPILAKILTLDDFAIFSICLVSSQLLIPILTVNCSSIISREYYEKKYVAEFYYEIVCLFLTILIMLLTLLMLFFNNYKLYFVVFTLMEAGFFITSTFVRFKYDEKPEFFLYFSLVKLFIVASGFLILFKIDSIDLISILLLLSFSNIHFLLFYFIYHLSKKNYNLNIVIHDTKYLVFAIALLPHVLSQWIISGMDRFFVKYYQSTEQLALYSIGYSIASVYMLVNSALALALPQLCVKNNSAYKDMSFKKYFFIVISLLSFVFLIFGKLLVFYFYDNNLYVYQVYISVFVGLYFLSYYYYYSSIVFYERNTYFISKSTIFVAVITLLMLVFISMVNAKYISFVTMLSYLLYFSVVYFKVEKSSFFEYSIISFYGMLLLGVGYVL